MEETKKEKRKALFRRLKFYGIGLGIGSIFMFIFTNNRGCSWMPGNRVRVNISERMFVIDKATEAKMASEKIAVQFLIETLNKGDIQFDKSKKEGKFKYYLLSHKAKNGRVYDVQFTLPNNSIVSEVHLVSARGKVVTENSKIGTGKIIRYFNTKDRDAVIYVNETNKNFDMLTKMGFYTFDSIPKSTKKEMQQDQGMPKEASQTASIQLKRMGNAFRKSAYVDFAKCNWDLTPNPEVQINFSDEKGNEYSAKTIMFQYLIELVEIQELN